jgi:hypothetical protein
MNWMEQDYQTTPLKIKVSSDKFYTSGVNSIIWGAGKDDAEEAGFDEGDKPADWVESLERRGISTRGGVLHEEARAVLMRYAQREGAIIYHPEKH